MIEPKKRTDQSVTMAEWLTYLDTEGRVINVEKLKLRIYCAVRGTVTISFFRKYALIIITILGHRSRSAHSRLAVFVGIFPVDLDIPRAREDS